MSTVTSCTLLSGRPAVTPVNSSGGRLQSGKAAAVALPFSQRKSLPLSVCFANRKGEHMDLQPFSISPVALVHPVSPDSPLGERWQLKEDAEAVSLWFQVPGLSKQDLVVEIDEDVLVIKRKAIDVQDQGAGGGGGRTATGGGAAASYKGSRDTPAAAAARGKADVKNIDVEDQQAGAGAMPGRDPTATGGGRPSRVTPASAAAKGKADAAYDGGVYARLLLPAGYNRESVKAELASGELTVTIFKVKEQARRRINVDIHVPSSR